MKPNVRITNIEVKNFKNVKQGKLSLMNYRKDFRASVVGIYGQNGSGKTALIDALELLKFALSGLEIPKRFADYIHVGSEYAEIEYTFDVTIEEETYMVIYLLSLKKENIDDSGNLEDAKEETEYRIAVCREILKAGDSKFRMGKIMDTDATDVFIPKSKYTLLIGSSREDELNLMVSKKVSQKMSRSFLFSKELLNKIRSHFVQQSEEVGANVELSHYLALLEALVRFGNRELFVINTIHSGMISLDAQPLIFRLKRENIGFFGSIALPMGESALIPEEVYRVAVQVIENMNTVLNQLVPGLTIGIKSLGQQLMESGEVGVNIELVSKKNGMEIPLKYESEGIKKIVSILQLLIVVYNQPSITVAIDEFDSGIFEYLLGELIRIISVRGKGQLIFTSHNLRPLETIDRGFIAFTTTNPNNRYIRMANVKENNNLRDFYYRDITLGEQDEEVYESTNNEKIAFAFREAGEYLGS